MAKLQFMNLEDLTLFKQKLDAQTNAAISTAVASAIKTVSVSSDGYTIYFYKKVSPANEMEAAFSVTLPAPVDITGKADKVEDAVEGNFAGLDAEGNLTDSGKKAADFATAEQGATADAAKAQADLNKAAIETINDESTGILKTAKDYADTQVAGLRISNYATIAYVDEQLATVYTKNEVDATVEGLQGSIDDLADLVGTLPEDATSTTVVDYVAEKVAAANQAASAKDAELEGKINTAQGAIDVLNGSGDGSVSKQVADAVAAIVNDAPEAFDTLKEISDWISSHSSDASAMNSSIQDNASDIDALEALVGTLPEGAASQTIVAYIKEYTDGKVGAIDLTPYATVANLKAATDRIKTNEEAIEAINAEDTGILAQAKEYTDTVTDGLHKPQLYTFMGDTTDVATAAASFNSVTFGNGDVIVIKADDGVSAAYQYDADNDPQWGALDGNVNADNVILQKDITLAGAYTTVGNVTKTQNGTGTLPAAGKSLSQVLTNIFTKELQPSKTEPSVSISFPQAGAYEVGTTVTPTYSASLSAGSYTYGPATGVTAKTWSIKDNATETTTLSDAAGSFPALTVVDGLNYNVTATATYDDGAVAVTNLGNTSEPEVKIAAGSKNKTSGAITGYRKSFYGAKTTKIELGSDTIRALSGVNSSTKSFSITIPDGATQVIVAVPNGMTLKTVADTGAFGTDIAASFVKSEVAVEGANGYAAKNYNVYVYEPAAALGANKYNVTIQ